MTLGLVTNSGLGYIKPLLTHFNLEHYFETVVTFGDVRYEGIKPSPKGLLLALDRLGVHPSPEILYIGDHNNDHIAAYNAGITPVMPAWATKKAVSMAPAIEMSSSQVLDYVRNPDEYKLFAEKCADSQSAHFERKGVYFLPLDDSANVITVRGEMTCLCLGRYFSQKAKVTALIHDKHALSKEIQKKEQEDKFVIPGHWPDLLAHAIRKGPEFVYQEPDVHFDTVTVIPSKKGRHPRLEALLEEISNKFSHDSHPPTFIPDVFYYLEDAQTQKSLTRVERANEAQRALHLNPDRRDEITGKRVLIIDDVMTTGSTMRRARNLAVAAGASNALGLAIAKTVSIIENERPCPQCGRALRIKRNTKTGDRFWGCSGYGTSNSCSYTETLISKECPLCSRPMSLFTNLYNVKFWSCTGYNKTPSCNHSFDADPDEVSI